jgi:hypothetical protein
MARYGRKAQDTVREAMHKRKHGTLKSGRSGRKVTSRKQAIAIGLSEAREKGAKVPSSPSRSRSRSGTRSGASRGRSATSRTRSSSSRRPGATSRTRTSRARSSSTRRTRRHTTRRSGARQ